MDKDKIIRIINIAEANNISLARNFYKLLNSKGYASLACEEKAEEIYWIVGRIFEDVFTNGISSEKIKDIQELVKIWVKLDDPKTISKLVSINSKIGGIMGKYSNLSGSKIKEVVITYIDAAIQGTLAIKSKKTKEGDIKLLEEALGLLGALRDMVLDVYDGKSKVANSYAKQIIGDKDNGLIKWWETTKNDMLSKSNNLILNQMMQVAVDWLQTPYIPKKKELVKDSDIMEFDASLFAGQINLDKVDEEASRFFEVLKEKRESLSEVNRLNEDNKVIREEIRQLDDQIDNLYKRVDDGKMDLMDAHDEILDIEREIEEKQASLDNNNMALNYIRAEASLLKDIIEKYRILESFYKTHRIASKELFYDIFSTLNFNAFLNALKPGVTAEEIQEVTIYLEATFLTISDRIDELNKMGNNIANMFRENPVGQIKVPGIRTRSEDALKEAERKKQEREDIARKEAERKKQEREELRRKRSPQKDLEEEQPIEGAEKKRVKLNIATNGEGKPLETRPSLGKNENEEAPYVPHALENNLKKKIKIKGGYKAPPISLLSTYDDQLESAPDDFQVMKEKIDQVMAEFDVPAVVTAHQRGPTFTRYELNLGEGYKVNKISQLIDNFKMRLEVKSIRLLMPIGGKNAFGLEIPNQQRLTIGLRSIIESDRFAKETDGLDLCFGLTNEGEKYIADLIKMPHMLVAGATGTGKSIFLKSLLAGLLFKYSPEELRFILIDPKRVELNLFRNLPHMLLSDTIKEYEEALTVLKTLVIEMDRRYKMLEDAGCTNIAEYNQMNQDKKLYRIILVVDEMADLMIQSKNSAEVENYIIRLAQLARAAGIHMILATQRPVVEFITGSIKSNIVSRVAFKVQSGRESSIVLDETGAEELLGMGDMLFSSADQGLIRMQGAYISSKEIKDICTYVIENNIVVVEDDNQDTAKASNFDDEIADIDDITK